MADEPIVPTATILPLEYSHGGPNWRSPHPVWHSLFAYFTVAVAIGLMASQLSYAYLNFGFFEYRSPIPAAMAGTAGLPHWQICVLIAFPVLGAAVALMLLIGGLRLLRDEPGTLPWLRRYSFWQIVLVVPNTVFVIAIATGIDSCNISRLTHSVDDIRIGAIAQAIAAIVWALAIRIVSRMHSGIVHWRAIDAPNDPSMPDANLLLPMDQTQLPGAG